MTKELLVTATVIMLCVGIVYCVDMASKPRLTPLAERRWEAHIYMLKDKRIVAKDASNKPLLVCAAPPGFTCHVTLIK